MGVRLRKSPGPMNERTTCRAREWVNDRKKRWRGRWEINLKTCCGHQGRGWDKQRQR